MGRKAKLTVEYYPHYIGDGKKMFIIQKKYKNDGYATWHKLIELLCKTENHYLDFGNKAELMFYRFILRRYRGCSFGYSK
jgi:hypothetical protein